jgi:hypothetical protein
MEDNSNIQPMKFENLTKAERKLLVKEFRKSVKLRYRILFWVGIFMFLPFLVSGGFSIYCLVMALIHFVLPTEFYIAMVCVNISGFSFMGAMSLHSKKFQSWLITEKGVE